MILEEVLALAGVSVHSLAEVRAAIKLFFGISGIFVFPLLSDIFSELSNQIFDHLINIVEEVVSRLGMAMKQ